LPAGSKLAIDLPFFGTSHYPINHCRPPDAELACAAEPEGRPLEWSPRELAVVEAATHAADRAAELRRLRRRESAHDEPRPSILAKFAAEVRLSERVAVELVVI